MIKICKMTHRVEDGEEESSAGHDLVEDDVGVKGDILVECQFFHLCNQISKKKQIFNDISEKLIRLRVWKARILTCKL